MPYNPYYPASNQGYQPPYQQPYQPPMQDRMAQLQNQYQAAVPPMYPPMQIQQPQQGMSANYMQAPQMVGRFVNDFSEITANDVPMDGRCAIFAKNDLTEIQARAWSAEGKIVPMVFKPVLPEPEQVKVEAPPQVSLSDEVTVAFMKRFDDITERLDKMEKSIIRPSASKIKKEVEAE